MYTDNRLQRVQRILRGVLFVVDVRFGDDVILLMSADKVDVLLSVVVHRSLQAQLLIDSLIELLAEVGHLLDEFLQVL